MLIKLIWLKLFTCAFSYCGNITLLLTYFQPMITTLTAKLEDGELESVAICAYFQTVLGTPGLAVSVCMPYHLYWIVPENLEVTS